MFSILTPGEKGKFYALIFLDVLITLIDLVFLAVLLLVIAYYTGTINTDWLPSSMLQVIQGHPLILIGSFLFLFALKNLLGFLVFKKQFHFVYDVASRLSSENLTHYLSGPYSEFVNTDSSIHTRRISQQTIEFSHHVLRGSQQVISNAVLILLTVATIVLFDATLFGLLILMLLPAVVLVTVYTRKKLAGIRESARVQREKSIQYLNEALSGYMESNIYQRGDFFTGRYAKAQKKFNEGLASQLVIQNLPARLMEVFAVLGLFLLVVINTYIIQSDSLLMLIGAFMAAAYKIIPGIVKILNHLQQIRIFSYTIDELKKERSFIEEKTPVYPSPIHSIEWRELTFSYGGQPILSGVSGKLEAGKLTGFSAASGAGKTTLIHLLLGFVEQDSGEIYFNEHKASQLERRSCWPRISYARQQSFLIHDSIQNNIALSDEPDMERLWLALNETGLTNFITESEKGLDTVITENGRNISGGQRQRIMMARALYRDADLYIFDEPFSELDKETSGELILHLQSLADSGKMVLLITHDPDALQNCSKIIRLHEN